MKFDVLIAMPDQAQCKLLHAIYSACPLVTHIEEVTNSEELYHRLKHTPPDFVVVQQPLLTDISLLPERHCVILAEQVDKDMLLAVTVHGIAYYFSDNPLPVAMLLAALDPTGASWMPECLVQAGLPTSHERLTHCQKRVFELRQEGLSYKAIAEQLQISVYTVKKHLEDARRKLRGHEQRIKYVFFSPKR